MSVQKPTPEDMEADLEGLLSIADVSSDPIIAFSAASAARRALYAEGLLAEAVEIVRQLDEIQAAPWCCFCGANDHKPDCRITALIAKVEGRGK